MQAIILASGTGQRLKPLTDTIPKCLIPIHGKTLLERMIESCIKSGIGDFIITTGPHEDMIKKFMKKKYSTLSVTYVLNNKYSHTNYIYSLWLVKDFIKGDVLTFHSDLIYNSHLLQRVVESPHTTVLVNKVIPLPKKDFKARVIKSYITEIGVNVFGNNAHFCLPLYKFLSSDWVLFLNEIKKFVKKGNITCYAEDALNTITHKVKITPLYYTEPAMEIDNVTDMKLACKLFT